ncbi:MAG TPA: acyl-CoA carboxylase subunit epsilon [Pseudonocardia sp.]|jgi:hypothetical protein|nr:acyl-CoA carboxylase subunit epsilon [Pseudonocardia sp.]
MAQTPETDDLAEATPEERRALFRVVRGEPDDAELAALTAVVLAAASSGSADGPPAPRNLWADKRTAQRQPLVPGPGAWRTSFLPR